MILIALEQYNKAYVEEIKRIAVVRITIAKLTKNGIHETKWLKKKLISFTRNRPTIY